MLCFCFFTPCQNPAGAQQEMHPFHAPLCRECLGSEHARDPRSSNPSQSVRVGIIYYIFPLFIFFFGVLMLTSCVGRQSHARWPRFRGVGATELLFGLMLIPSAFPKISLLFGKSWFPAYALLIRAKPLPADRIKQKSKNASCRRE